MFVIIGVAPQREREGVNRLFYCAIILVPKVL